MKGKICTVAYMFMYACMCICHCVYFHQLLETESMYVYCFILKHLLSASVGVNRSEAFPVFKVP